jgi:hypothetical protein
MIKDALKDIFPKGPTTFGANPKSTKIESTGDAHGTGVIGYRISPEKTETTQEKKKRKKHKRNNNNPSEVGAEGTDIVRKQSDDVTPQRREYDDIMYVHKHFGDAPMLRLVTTIRPFQMLINEDNPEYFVLVNSKTREARALAINANLGEIRANVDESLRIQLWKERINALKASGQFPKQKISQPQGKGTKGVSNTWS